MIQRIQSLFLFLVDVVLVALFFVPFMYTDLENQNFGGIEVPLSAYGSTLLDYPALIVGQALLCVLAGFTMVMFKNRKLQMRLCITGMILSVIYSCLLAVLPTMINDMMSTPLGNELTMGIIGKSSIGPGTWISLANFLLFFLAWRFIKKDEELVRSTDRLR